ncbi:Tetratricopeptide repeat protein [Caulifigura coniformis]|uniref:Tetratricopeptide repeat protein n=1 Tax=Caulifigura coniformis TaxID=2527983 RepID=A0A517SLR6_9PLAN|nr:tetratricopeptide repeat protein [Caulifigura coniformis]QDT57060.1 Tetratricopeptide repeat protein [Caulifigura coniformis]
MNVRQCLIASIPAAIVAGVWLSGWEAPAEESGRPVALRMDGLGPHRREVTAANAEAKQWFNQGLMLLYAFNHDEAIHAFRAAVDADPGCAMAHWGIALAVGPHINFPLMTPQKSALAWSELQLARQHSANGTEVEKALIEALASRYAEKPPEDRVPLDKAYAEAMQRVWQKFPGDADVGALYAEAVMDLRPWDLWPTDGEARPERETAIAVLRKVLELSPAHPLGCHLYIHAVEAGPNPGEASEAADRLRTASPGLGHLVHMPSHIDVRTGRWQQAVEANERAIRADNDYRGRRPEQDFYRIYMAHNRHMLAFAAMMQGQSARAEAEARQMLADIPESWLAVPENLAMADGFFAAPIKVLVRFGKWDAVLAEPEPVGNRPIAHALWREARGVALAAKGQVAEARAEQRRFRDAVRAVPEEARFGNNSGIDLLKVADALLEGEILVKEGKMEEGIAKLREAVRLEDLLRYDEPPGWIIPVRHALGTWLIKAGKPEEAEAVYRKDLETWPHNGWSLFGLSQSLDRQDKMDDMRLVRARFQEAWRSADVELKSSCFCQTETP